MTRRLYIVTDLQRAEERPIEADNFADALAELLRERGYRATAPTDNPADIETEDPNWNRVRWEERYVIRRARKGEP